MNMDKFKTGAVGGKVELEPPFPLADALARESGDADSVLEQMLARADLSDEDRAGVLRALRGVPLQASENFPPEVNDRLAVAEANARANLARVPRDFKDKAEQLLRVAIGASTASQRFLWIRRAADAIAEGYAPVSACKAGCSHCCHIPVKISQAEAQALGKAIGRKPLAPAQHGPEPAYQEPCSFLQDGRCSIYSERPAVCRYHLNMDIDDLLCRPVAGAAVPVPYLDSRHLAMARVATGGRTAYADIRQWFPREPAPA